MYVRNPNSPKQLILTYLTDFIYLTPLEIIDLCERVYEDVNTASLVIALWHLKKSGKLATKKALADRTVAPRGRKMITMFRRKTAEEMASRGLRPLDR